jgi:hypothetical protein
MKISIRLIYIALYIFVLAVMTFKQGLESSDIVKVIFSSASILVFLMLFKLNQQVGATRDAQRQWKRDSDPT